MPEVRQEYEREKNIDRKIAMAIPSDPVIDVTVAALIESEGKFLIVEEQTSFGLQLSQPSGHLAGSESLLHAIQRKMIEETAYVFEPLHLTGIYQWWNPQKIWIACASLFRVGLFAIAQIRFWIQGLSA